MMYLMETEEFMVIYKTITRLGQFRVALAPALPKRGV